MRNYTGCFIIKGLVSKSGDTIYIPRLPFISMRNLHVHAYRVCAADKSGIQFKLLLTSRAVRASNNVDVHLFCRPNGINKNPRREIYGQSAVCMRVRTSVRRYSRSRPRLNI